MISKFDVTMYKIFYGVFSFTFGQKLNGYVSLPNPKSIDFKATMQTEYRDMMIRADHVQELTKEIKSSLEEGFPIDYEKKI